MADFHPTAGLQNCFKRVVLHWSVRSLFSLGLVNMIYFSRRNSNSDWLKNAIANPLVKVEFNGEKFSGSAKLVDDDNLARKISSLKYTDKARQEESRIVLEVSLSIE